MKTLDIAPFDITVAPATGDVPAQTQPYPVKDALINVLFGQPGLKAREILRRDDIARKILAADGSALPLEDAEYDQLKQAFDVAEGFGRNDVELVRRVLTAQ